MREIPKAIAVYKAVNSINGKMYIGQTSRPERRFAEHTWKGSKSKILSAAIKKYGKEQFTFAVLCWCPDKDYADYVEQKLIEAHNTRRVGYNICIGGEGLGTGENHPSFGKKRSDKCRKKISEAKLGEKNPMFGKQNTPEQKEKIRASLKGRKITWGDKISAAKKGICTNSLEQIIARAEQAAIKNRQPVRATNGETSIVFGSIKECATVLGYHEVSVQRFLREAAKTSKGWVFTREPKHGE
jgi:group I intron endonuclease